MMTASEDQTRTAKVLVVDDEMTVRETVGLNLHADGYDVVYAADGYEALTVARETHPDLVVLDVMLPGRNGYEVCRALRQESSVPILFLSARGGEFDRIAGLELGADDYLTKPFAMRELVARVRAMLRRARMGGAARGGVTLDVSRHAINDDRHTIGDIVIDAARHEAWSRGQQLSLTSKEFGLLQYLARHPGIVLSREALLREVWGYDYPVGTRTVDVHIGWLRQKVEEDPSHPRRILTVRGHGYRLVPSDHAISTE